jgi:(p)ppGpp synthase/HD superfamily hydrolase
MTTYQPQDTFGIAAKAHEGQTRKGGGSYIIHPCRVSKRFEQYSIKWQAALLHDILEDTNTTETDLFNLGVPFEVVEIVKLLTKKKSENYQEFIYKIIDSGNKAALQVKIADIQDNLSDSPTPRQLIKYGQALVSIGIYLDKREEIL